MWDIFRLSAGGNFSLRKIALLIMAVLMSAMFVAITHSSSVFAEPASIDGDSLTYNGKTYSKKDLTLPDTKPGDQFFVGQPDSQNIVAVVIVPSNPDTENDFPAVIRYYKVDGNGNYSSPDPPRSEEKITVTSKKNGDDRSKTGCAVEGVGWIICSTSRFIAGGMDRIYEWIQGFLTVNPLSTDTTSGLYQAWEIARGVANACFILAFLVIIYSQITSYGISNYEIKKMIPKLIIAAVLVNVSYYICAIAVDVSNILGDSVQQAMIDIRNSIPGAIPGANGGANWGSFENWTEYILSGGTVTVAGIAGLGALATATGGSVVSLIFLLFPVLVAGVLSVLVALAVLAARQALITVLIVLAPLAFVAFLLPNTEKWFEKWRGLLMTMLLVFPLFSLLFGGSQLAASLIIQNATQASVVILALFVQVAPLIVTPFLIRFSGSLLGRFAGMINNPQKGLVDRTRNWSKEKADRHAERAKALGANQQFGLRRVGYNREMKRRYREGRKALYTSQLDAAWSHDERAHELGVQSKYADMSKNAGHAETELAYERRLAHPNNKAWQHMQGRQLTAQAAIKNYQTASETAFNEAGAEDMHADNRFAAFHQEAMAQSTQAQMLAYRNGTAQAMQRIDYAKALTGAVDANADAATRAAAQATAQQLATAAGGIDSTGADSARASALAALKKSKLESIAEGRALSQYFNLTATQRQQLAKGISVTGRADDGTTRVFTAKDSGYVRLSAIEDQVSQGTVEEALELIMQTGHGRDLYEHREVVTEAMLKGGVPQKASFLSGKAIDDIRAGRMQNTNDLLKSALSAIAKGKLSPEQLLNQDRKSMEVIVEAVEQWNNGHINLEGAQAFALRSEVERLFASANTAMTDTRINVRLGERATAMRKLANMGRQGTNHTPPMGGSPLPPPPPTTPPPDPDADFGG